MVQSTLDSSRFNKEWIQGTEQRLDIAYKAQYTNPRLSMEILIEIVNELLGRL